MEGENHCLNCRNIFWGDSCPFCGSYFSYQEKSELKPRQIKEENVRYWVRYNRETKSVECDEPAGPFCFWPRNE
jgi:hypothetical protein